MNGVGMVTLWTDSSLPQHSWSSRRGLIHSLLKCCPSHLGAVDDKYDSMRWMILFQSPRSLVMRATTEVFLCCLRGRGDELGSAHNRVIVSTYIIGKDIPTFVGVSCLCSSVLPRGSYLIPLQHLQGPLRHCILVPAVGLVSACSRS